MIGIAGYRIHRAVEVVIGVDTHKDQHVAVAIDGRGVRLAEWHVPATTTGYEELEKNSNGGRTVWETLALSGLRVLAHTGLESLAS